MEDILELSGAYGAGFGLRQIVSDVDGVSGSGFGIKAKAILYITDTFGRNLSGITAQLTWTGGSASFVNIDAATNYFIDSVPYDTPITLAVAATGIYAAATATYLIPIGGFRRLDLKLPFLEQYARITKKRYL